MSASSEQRYDVVWPLGPKAFLETSTQDRPTDLSGKTLAACASPTASPRK